MAKTSFTPRIFVSYRRSESGTAGRIFDRLLAHFGEQNVFIDIDDIPFGVDFRQHIVEALRPGDLLLAIVGKNWLGSDADGKSRINDETDPVRVEIETALERNIRLLPVLVDDATMPAEADLPASIREFAYRNAVEVEPGRDFNFHVDRLIRSIHKILDGKLSPVAATAAAPASKTKGSRRMIVAGALGLVGLAVIAVGALMFPGGRVSVESGESNYAVEVSRQQASHEAALTAWNVVKDMKSVGVLEAFIARFGDTFYADLAKDKLAALRKEEKEKAAPASSPESANTARDAALEAWNAVKDSEDAAALEAFIARFGDSFYAELAKAKLSALKSQKAAAVKAETPVVPASASATLLRSMQGHSGKVIAAAFSSDGTQIASGGDDRTVRLWATSGGDAIRTIQGGRFLGSVQSLAFSPRPWRDDVRDVLAVDSFGSEGLGYWDVNRQKVIWAITPPPNKTVRSPAFSPNNNLIAAGIGEFVNLILERDGRIVHRTQDEPHGDVVSSVAFSPDGARLASGSWDKIVKLWEVTSDSKLIPLRTLEGHSSKVTSVVFLKGGTKLASGSEDATVKIWDAENGNLLRTLQGHSAGVNSIAASRDGRLLASASSDKTIKIWSVATGRLLQTLSGHADSVNVVAFSPDDSLLLSGSSDGTIKIWDVKSVRTAAH